MIDLVEDWRPWFAWYPILVNGEFVFWKWLERRKYEQWHYTFSWGPKTDRHFCEYRRLTCK